MKTFVRLNGRKVTSVVSALNRPDGYVELDAEKLPIDLTYDLSAYEYDGHNFLRVRKSDEEKRIDLEVQARQLRSRLLQASDWTQIADAAVDQAAWKIYRQALRDVPQQEGFPENVIWPTPPE